MCPLKLLRHSTRPNSYNSGYVNAGAATEACLSLHFSCRCIFLTLIAVCVVFFLVPLHTSPVLHLQKQLVAIVSAGLYEDLTLNDVKIRNVAPVSSRQATTKPKGISVFVQITVPFNDNPHAVVDAILSQTFKSLLAEKLYEQGLGIMASSLSISRPQIVSLVAGGGTASSSSAASAAAATQRQKKLVLLGIGGFVVLVYVVLGVAALCRRTGSAGAEAGSGHELTMSAASGTRISEQTPLAHNSDVVAAGQKGGIAVTPDGLGGDMDDGGVFI